MTPQLGAITVAVFVATMLGGTFAIKLNRKLHLILGFSAGAVVGVSLFDLMPEAIELLPKGMEAWHITLCTGIGFLLYMILDRAAEQAFAVRAKKAANGGNTLRGILGGSCLVLHSCMDGLAIGFGFQVSEAAGALIAAAVLAHDFADGINTVNVVLKAGSPRRTAFRWLIADAIAPVIGILITLCFAIPQADFVWVLGIFSGFFLYLGAAELVPDSYISSPRRATSVATILGACLILVVTRIAG